MMQFIMASALADKMIKKGFASDVDWKPVEGAKALFGESTKALSLFFIICRYNTSDMINQ